MGAARSTSNVLYVLSDALRSLRENLATTVLTSVTLGFALAIFAFFVIIFINLNGVVAKWGDRTHVIVYISDSFNGSPESLRATVGKVNGVKSVNYVSKERAIEDLKAELKGYEGILEGVDTNPLPASLEIRVEDAYVEQVKLKAVVDEIKNYKWVDDIQYSREWIEKFNAFVNFLELAALIVGVFLAAATLFIISNTIRLTVYARKDEIEVMKLVGASDMYVKVPFFIEGVVQGFAGGVLALGILVLGRMVIAARVPPYLDFVFETVLSAPALLVVLVLSGITLGVAGSLISMARFLKV